MFVLAGDPAVVQLQITTWLQILAGILSLIGTAIYVGWRIGRMETRLDTHLSTIEQIGTHVSSKFSDQEQQMRELSRTVQQHEVQLTAINVSLSHREQAVVVK